MITGSRCAAGALAILSAAGVRGETNAAGSSAPYSRIVERNCFELKPPAAVPSCSEPAKPPTEDLLLTGLTAGLTDKGCALFEIVDPGKPPSYFALHEGEQNEWLELRSINVRDQTVRAVLRKPVVRARATGVEIILSFPTHGIRSSGSSRPTFKPVLPRVAAASPAKSASGP
jgi:hypothetical protein